MMNKIHGVYSNTTRRLPLIFLTLILTIPLFTSPSYAEEPSPSPSPTSTSDVEPVADSEPTTIINNEYVFPEYITLSESQFYSILFVLTLNVGLLLANFIVTHTKPISLGRL